MQEQKFFLRCAANVRARLDWLRSDQNKTKFTNKAHAVALQKEKLQTFYHFSRLCLCFPDFFQVWKIAGQISRLSRIQDSVWTLLHKGVNKFLM